MVRACPRSLLIGLLLALCALSFMIATVSNCAGAGTTHFAQGPFCSVEHASSPVHKQKTTPEMALTQELAAIIIAAFSIVFFSKRLLQKTLVRFIGIVGRIGRREHVRTRSGPTPFSVWLPQVSASHGM